eukprot:3042024-Prymnesium_polylepis.1
MVYGGISSHSLHALRGCWGLHCIPSRAVTSARCARCAGPPATPHIVAQPRRTERKTRRCAV